MNVLAPLIENVTVAQLADAGVKRVSIGGALARAAHTALLQAGMEMLDQGSFGWASNLASGTDVNKLLGI